ncbi:MAG: transporter substrate-binding domain-containing protein [Paraglaciecola sp.]|uniref:substrate-binding periplasmic protein n=1 Tax=Paraglaciecola sp. TaxID=1920173 RepID=UPI003263075D
MRLIIHSLIFILFASSSSYAVAEQSTNKNLVAVANSNRLLQYYENGENKGPSIGILQAVLKEAQLDATVKFMPWVRAFSTAKNNPNTLILSMIRTPEREADFHWIIQVSNLSRVFISLASKPENYVDNMQQAKHKLVATIVDSASYNELISHGFSEQENLYRVPDSEVMVTLLESGKVDLLYAEPNSIKHILKRRGKNNIALSYEEIESKNDLTSYIAISQSTDIEIVKRLQQAARKFEKTAEYNRLLFE